MKSIKLATFRLVIQLLSLVVILTMVSSAQDFVFNAASFATGHDPQGVTNADLNGDTRPDLVIANFDDNTVSVMLGNPDGTYQPHVDYATGNNPTAVLVGDFNADGKPDIAVVNNNCPTTPCTAVGSVSVLLGNGDGTFQSHLDTKVGNSPKAFAATDLNVDGMLDLLVVNGEDNTLQILQGKNTGKFFAKVGLPTGLSPSDVAVGEFTNDGKLDAVVANSGESDITLFQGRGDGTFLRPLTFPTGPNPNAIIGVDFNGDGKLDVATTNGGSSTVSILTGKDPVGFLAHFEVLVAGISTSIVAGDFNGDGIPDFATGAVGPDSVSVVLGNGNNTFQTHIDFATGFDPRGVTAGDFTGDGKIDLAVVNDLDNTVTILPGEGNGLFQNRFQTTTGNMPGAVATGDFNSDLKEDMAVVNRSDNTVLVLLGNSDGTFTPVAGPRPITGLQPSAIVAGDFNHDGKLDLATANSGGNTISIMLGNGDGTFQTPTFMGVGKKPIAIVSGDFNKDGKQDLAVCNQNDPSVSILLGNNNGTFVLSHSYFTGTGGLPTGLAIADFIGNDRLDLAVTNSATSTVAVLLGFGDGTFTAAVNYPTGTTPTGIAIADFNGDGKPDLAVSARGVNSVSIMLGSGTGTFPTHVEYPTGKVPLSVVAADFNGDGKMDVAVGSSTVTGNRVSVLVGNGDGTLQGRVDHATKAFSQGTSEALAADDFDGDGSEDIAAVEQVANSVSVFLNTPLPVLFPQRLDFGTHNIGVTSSPKTVTLFNSGSAPLLDLLPPTASGDYAVSPVCPTSLPVGENCQSFVTFTPVDGGVRPGLLTFTDNAPGPAQNVALTGIGNAPTAQLSTHSLTFGITIVKQISATQNVTLINTGNQALLITSIVASPEFQQSNTCGSSVAAGASCILRIAFRPADGGVRTGTVTITDNAVDSPQVINLTGTGTLVQLTPTSLAFGPQKVGTSSDPKVITLTNMGNRPLTVTSISIVGTNALDFPQTNNCIPGVPRGQSCTINVTFTPTGLGARTASVSIEDDGGASPQMAPLTGTGTN